VARVNWTAEERLWWFANQNGNGQSSPSADLAT
jgi:hypothetical protein